MPRRRRHDAPGRLHHIGNKGLHDEPLFVLGSDFERFFDLLAEAVEAKRVKVYSAVLMTNHFHLFAESVDGRISRTIQWVTGQLGYHVNRTRGLKGYVHGGRFWSTPVRTRAHTYSLIPYIDWNPVAAGMVQGPFLYPFGSAVHHIDGGERPAWLCGDLVDALIRPKLEVGLSRLDAYVQTFGLDRRSPPGYELVRSRLAHPSRGRDDLDWLLSADGRRMTSWLRRKARSKLRPASCLPMADAESVHQAITQRTLLEPGAVLVAQNGRKRPLWPVAEAGLLRDLAGLTYVAIADVMGMSATHVKDRYRLHRKAMLEDEMYAAVSADAATAALQGCFGSAVCDMAAEIFRRRVRESRSEGALEKTADFRPTPTR